MIVTPKEVEKGRMGRIGLSVLSSVPLTVSLPTATAIFAGYCTVCWFGSQSLQKIASLGLTLLMAVTVLTLSISFLLYISRKIRDDSGDVSNVTLRPYIMILLLSGYAIYAALLHPREVTSLVYGLAYAILFPAIFVALPVYALANMLDQSWGTREAGTHRCCQDPEEEEIQDESTAPVVRVSELPSLSTVNPDEDAFWVKLCDAHVGNDVNVGKCPIYIADGLRRLRIKTMLLFLAANFLWALGLTTMYIFVGSDVICYLLMGIFSLSLILQLTGLTCYKVNLILEKYLTLNGFTFSQV
ncbi:chitin synthase [Elysia marginata]|uniref:Chitin synthase n=1 Tax=Elysia marginata TaxID=1093978 RepID=A0AAV4H6P0_9GAST|nr:chitin synthase [Elysia marginata]